MDIQKVNGAAGVPTIIPLEGAPPAAEPRTGPERPAPEADGRRRLLDDTPLTPDELEQAVGQLNKLSLIFDRSLQFSVDDGLGNMRVKVIDNASQKVIREFPPERLVDVLRRIREAVGVLIDEKA